MAFSGDNGWLAAADGRTVQNYTTGDFGQSWHQCGHSWPMPEVGPWNSASFLDAKNGWLTIASYTADKRELPYLGGVAKTVDGGCTWTVIWRDSEEPDESLGDIRFVDAQVGWLFSYDGRLLETSDGGAHWQAVGLPDDLRLEGAYLESTSRGWVLGSAARGSGLYYTSDSGAQWHRIPVAEIRSNRGMAREIPPKWGAGLLRLLQLRR